MGPKVIAACDFARTRPATRPASAGSTDIDEMLAGTAGTIVTTEVEGIEYRTSLEPGTS